MLPNESVCFQRRSVVMSVYFTAARFFSELSETWCLIKRRSKSSRYCPMEQGSAGSNFGALASRRNGRSLYGIIRSEI